MNADEESTQAEQRLNVLKQRLKLLRIKPEQLGMSLTDAAIRLGRLEARVDIIEKKQQWQ
jgi:hypothetical protein